MPASHHIVSANKMVLGYDALRELLDAPPPRVIDDWAEFVLPHNEAQCGPLLYQTAGDPFHLPVNLGKNSPLVLFDEDIGRKLSDPLPEPAPGDYCEDAVEVAPGVWEWRGQAVETDLRSGEDLDISFSEYRNKRRIKGVNPIACGRRTGKSVPFWDYWVRAHLRRERLIAEDHA